MEGISRRELARRHDISESTVRRHVESGALAHALLSDGSLDSRKAGEALRRVLSAGKVVPRDLAEARARHLRAQVRKLCDEVFALVTTSAQPTAAFNLAARELELVARHVRLVPEGAASLAGRAPDEVQRELRGLIFDALEAISGDDGPEEEWWNDPPAWPRVDIDALSPNALQARRIDLAAQKMEIQRALAQGELVGIEAAMEAFESRLTTIKSGLLAIPARVAYAVADATPDTAGRIVSAEVEELLADRDSRAV